MPRLASSHAADAFSCEFVSRVRRPLSTDLDWRARLKIKHAASYKIRTKGGRLARRIIFVVSVAQLLNMSQRPCCITRVFKIFMYLITSRK